MNSPISEMPQDSTLRRHWLAANGMQDPNLTTTPPAPDQTNTARTEPNASAGGIFSWFKSLFS